MTENTEKTKQRLVAAERRRCADIAAACVRAGVPHLAGQLVLEGVSLEEAESEILMAMSAGAGRSQ